MRTLTGLGFAALAAISSVQAASPEEHRQAVFSQLERLIAWEMNIESETPEDLFHPDVFFLHKGPSGSLVIPPDTLAQMTPESRAFALSRLGPYRYEQGQIALDGSDRAQVNILRRYQSRGYKAQIRIVFEQSAGHWLVREYLSSAEH